MTLIRRPGKGDARDELTVDDGGGLRAFHDLGPLREYGHRNGKGARTDEETGAVRELLRAGRCLRKRAVNGSGTG